MAPKNLIKEAFKNIYRQKSMNALRGRRGDTARSQTYSPTEPMRPKSAPLRREDSPGEESHMSGLMRNREREQTDETISATSQENEINSTPTSPESSVDKTEVHDDFYCFALEEVKGHLATIELSLAILEAFKGMSPCLDGIQMQLKGKKEKCEKNLAWLKVVRGQDSEMQVADVWGAHAGEEGKAAWL
ncbi:hypothetical protein DM02DRAFT_629653 [Periconia macrospinosa]|uniref:Uncharacterized protein n=1 Tax=Periconia macrospinosa TaxID=97972 RepID=A0A2V1DPK1_9PLEO|nr:hypothetical protein DM02DRAFT_629653 [Periconia macrospinosa]